MNKIKLSSAAYLFFLLGLTIPSAAQIRVMPLGDSAVLGTGSSTNDVGGFRDDLSLFLSTYLIPFDLVGSLNDGISSDPDHEGHAGFTVNGRHGSGIVGTSVPDPEATCWPVGCFVLEARTGCVYHDG